MKGMWMIALAAALPLVAAHAEVEKKTKRLWKAKVRERRAGQNRLSSSSEGVRRA